MAKMRGFTKAPPLTADEAEELKRKADARDKAVKRIEHLLMEFKETNSSFRDCWERYDEVKKLCATAGRTLESFRLRVGLGHDSVDSFLKERCREMTEGFVAEDASWLRANADLLAIRAWVDKGKEPLPEALAGNLSESLDRLKDLTQGLKRLRLFDRDQRFDFQHHLSDLSNRRVFTLLMGLIVWHIRSKTRDRAQARWLSRELPYFHRTAQSSAEKGTPIPPAGVEKFLPLRYPPNG